MQGQVTEIKASFENSLTRVPIRYRTDFFKELVRVVSTAALELIESDLAAIGTLGVIAADCDHRRMYSHGLPCAHMLTQYIVGGRNIPSNDMHNIWKKLSITPFSEDPTEEVTIDAEWEILSNTFARSTVPQKLFIKKQLRFLGKASCTTILEPKTKANLRGRPKKKTKANVTVDRSTKREPSTFEYAAAAHVFKEPNQSQGSQNSAREPAVSVQSHSSKNKISTKKSGLSCVQQALKGHLS